MIIYDRLLKKCSLGGGTLINMACKTFKHMFRESRENVRISVPVSSYIQLSHALYFGRLRR